jgi:hypothetical protein
MEKSFLALHCHPQFSLLWGLQPPPIQREATLPDHQPTSVWWGGWRRDVICPKQPEPELSIELSSGVNGHLALDQSRSRAGDHWLIFIDVPPC